MKKSTLHFQHCTIAISEKTIFHDFSWVVNPDETWIVTGPNGSGKSALAAALLGQLNTQANPDYPDSVWSNSHTGATGVLSFDTQQDLILSELRNDDSDFVEGGIDAGTTVRACIQGKPLPQNTAPAFERITRQLGISHLLDRGIKFLSTGEIRKVLLAKYLINPLSLLILDDFTQGLDTHTRQLLADQIDQIIQAKRPQLIIMSDRYQDLPPAANRVLCLENCQVSFAGNRNDFEASPCFRRLYGQHQRPDVGPELLTALSYRDAGSISPGTQTETSSLLVDMQQVYVAWDGKPVLENFSWQLHPGEHTLIRGPNGCGKSSLLKLITGDNPQVFSNDVTVLGIKRGSGESVWDIKAKLGYVSYQFHLDYLYLGHASLAETLLSGFHDSIGLYTQPGHSEIAQLGLWLDIMGLTDKRNQSFNSLSYGEQRAALVARAAIKGPPLLILDEPCHGLDSEHRQRVLDIADYIGTHSSTTLIYVTHDPNELLACTKQVLDFVLIDQPEDTVDGLGLAPRYRYMWSTGIRLT